jgi:hypothetical protein
MYLFLVAVHQILDLQFLFIELDGFFRQLDILSLDFSQLLFQLMGLLDRPVRGQSTGG